MSAEAMYDEVILDYYRHPLNFGRLEKSDVSAKDVNVSCGDEIEIQLAVENNAIRQIAFSGKGCAISQAATSMLTEHVQNMTLDNATQLKKEEIIGLLNIPLSPMRLKCALLGFKVFKMCIYAYLGRKMEDVGYGDEGNSH